jgi:hypothetical protein
VVVLEGGLVVVQVSRQIGLSDAGMMANCIQHQKVIPKRSIHLQPVASVDFHATAIGIALAIERLTGFAQLIVLMDPLHGLLQADGDDETDDDGGDVDEEVFPGVGGFVGRVDV